MKRKLKNLGMTIVASLALAALTAPSASAAEFHTGLIYPLNGEQVGGEGTDTFTAGTFRCNNISYTGELRASTSSTLRLTPSYSGCNAFGFTNAIATTNGCEFVLDTQEGNNADISCPAGKSIVISSAGICEVTIGSQSNLKTISYTNEEAEGSRHIRIVMNLTGMSYVQHNLGYCSSNGTNPYTTGKRVGEITLKAGAPEPAGLWYE